MTDRQPNTRSDSRRVTLSWDRVVWTTHTAVLDGRAFVMIARSGGGTISTGASGYAGGVKLTSNSGVAGVQYRFKVTTGAVYKTLSFAVYGRSPNGHKAVIAIWNPDLGGYKTTGSFDAVRPAGPGAAWWTSTTDMSGRVREGSVRAVVMVAKGLGGSGSSIFDIKDVRITYRTGTLRATTAVELDALDAALIVDTDGPVTPTQDRHADRRLDRVLERTRFGWPSQVLPD